MSTLAFEDTWLPLQRSGVALANPAKPGQVAAEAAATFDLDPSEHCSFDQWMLPEGLGEFALGVIVGASGSGKTTLLRTLGNLEQHTWTEASVADHFTSAAEAAERLYAAGLSSVPAWMKPYSVLSNGERFRADLARSLHDGALVDEFTSVVDRTVAKAASMSISRHIRKTNLHGIVLATCHRDVLPWLEPDWVIDTDAAAYSIKPRECLQRPQLVAEVSEVDRAMWQHFMGHHYLTGNLHPFARCYLATVDDEPAAFAAAIPFPHGYIKNAWRGHRTVTLPDFQGMGLGVRLSDWVAEAHVRGGYRFFSKTTHRRLGEYRDHHPCWRPTSGNHKAASNGPTAFGRWTTSSRLSWSHEFVMEAK